MTFPDWRFLGGFNLGSAFTSAQHGAYWEAAAFAMGHEYHAPPERCPACAGVLIDCIVALFGAIGVWMFWEDAVKYAGRKARGEP